MSQAISDIISQLLAPDEHPVADASQEQIESGRGLSPKDMTPEERQAHRNKLQRKRARQYRKRQAARQENEAKERKTTLAKGHLKDAMDVTALLSEKIDLVAQRRARKAARLLGTVAEDATFATFEAVNRSITGAIVREERTKEELLEAAEWVSKQPGIPSIRKGEEEVPGSAGWLMSVIEFRSRSAIQDWYGREPTIESLAYGDDALADGNDDFYDRFCAKSQPLIVGARWPQPGQVDHGIVQAMISGAITERGLDALVELILNNLRSDGSFSWKEHAEEVFLALGLDMHWHLLCRKIDSPELRGRYAKDAARRAAAFILPTMRQATKMIERGYWSPPDPQRIHLKEQTMVPDPQAQARVIISALEAVQEAMA